MKRYNFQDLEYFRCSDAEGIEAENNKLKNINEKLKIWHAKALRMQAKMTEDLEPLYDKIEDLEEQNKEMLDKLKFVVECGGVLLEGQLYDEIIPVIEKIEKEKDK